jgi:hypothetical protein
VARIPEPELQSLVETWSPLVIAALTETGSRRWPPHREKQGFLKRPRLIPRFTVEGPVWRGGEILWAASHTLSPSAFDKRGSLTQGEREYWIVRLSTGEAPRFRIEGAQAIEDVPVREDTLQAALVEALAAGPKQDRFYGNRGPLSHR